MSDSIPHSYKMTDVGVIPEDWETTKLSEVSEVVRGGSPRPAGDPRFFNGNYIPWLTVAALTNIPDSQLYVSETTSMLTEAGSHHSRTLESSTVIIANSGATLGIAKILSITCCANDGIAALLQLSSVDSRFVCYYINSKTKQLREAVATGNGQPNLNTTLIGNFSIPLPTLTEQRAIADALSNVDEQITALDEAIAKKRDLKQGAMQRLLTGEERLPGFSGAWTLKSLEQCGEWKGGGTPSKRIIEYWINGVVPWVSSGDVKTPRLSETTYYITDEAILNSSTTVVDTGAIIIVMRSGILRKYLPAALNSVPMAINQDIKALIPHNDIDPDFLLHVTTKWGDDILAKCLKTGTTVESIEFKWLKAYQIPIPPTLQEQQAIASVLSDMDAEISALEAQREKTVALKTGMMQELLTGKTRLI